MKVQEMLTGIGVSAMLTLSLAACSQAAPSNASGEATQDASTDEGATATASTATATAASSADRSSQRLTDADISVGEAYEDASDGGHALAADGQAVQYANIAVTKTGDSSGDEADFYGENAALFATNGATLTLSDALISTNGTHANGVFSYGTGTTVNVSHSVIRTTGNCSGGLMTTGGGTMNATDVTAETTGNSSAAIRSDRGGGTVNVNGGYFTTAGTGSPVIYSTADISVSDAYLQSTASQGVVVEGKNSVALTDCQLIASNTTKNSNKSDFYQAVMIYQSMSGDASSGTSSFSMTGGSLTNENGDIFFVNNTACNISLTGASIVNNDATGVFLRAAAAGWGSAGSNGGHVNLNASGQVIDGNLLVDDSSTLNLYLHDASSFTGAVNPDGQTGDVYVELDANSTWTLTADSYVSSLMCVQGTINLNGHKLYVNGQEYDGESASGGSAFDIASAAASGASQGGALNAPGGKGAGGAGGSGATQGEPPAKPN